MLTLTRKQMILVLMCVLFFNIGCVMRTPEQKLSLAVSNGDLGKVHSCLKDGANPTSALPEAVKYRRLEIARLLLQQGADPNIGDGYLIEEPVAIDHDTSMRTFYRYSIKKTKGRTPIHTAIDSNDLEMIRLLLQYGADVTEPRVSENALICPDLGGNSKYEVWAMQAAVNQGQFVINMSGETICAIDHDIFGLRAYQLPFLGKVCSALDYAKLKRNSAVVEILQNREQLLKKQ